MGFVREIHEQYQKAYAKAIAYQQKNKKNSLPVCPISLEGVLNERMISYRQDLGIMEIPTNLIVGVAEKSHEMFLFSKEFFPVSQPNSTTAEQWRQAYSELLIEKKSTTQIVCYEYLGKFYVSDGLMQVSVAKFAGIPMIQSQVIRVMPNNTDCKEVELYFDFLTQYRLTDLYQIQFTQPGFFEEMQRALGKKHSEQWTEHDRTVFLDFWPVIENAYRESFDDFLSITVADAFVVLLRKFAYRQILRMDSWMLARILQTCWKELYSLNCSGTESSPNSEIANSLQTA